MTKEFKATHEGQLQILNKVLPCAVLEDGTRIISQSSIFVAFETTLRGRANRDKSIREKVCGLPAIIDANNLLPYINQGIQDMQQVVNYRNNRGTLKRGYKADILPLLCDIYLQARKDKVLTMQQRRYAEISEVMVRSLSKIGITALVDEATGYQNSRPKNALQTLLDLYLNKECLTWARKFPDEFYKEMFRLKGWDVNKNNPNNRPGAVGHYTNDIIYDRLAPGILDELRSRQNERKYVRYHQFLTEELGHPALSQHMHTVIAFMKVSDNWDNFKSMLDKVLPKKDAQLLLEGEI